jgi:glycine/D-amino acid oxidase-like deaminating enzyme
VVCAANTWSPGLLRTAGVDLPVTPRRAQVAYFRRPAALASRHHVVLDTTSAMYTRPNGPDEVLGGAAEVTGETPSDPDALAETLDADFPDAVRERLGRRIPALGDAAFVWGQAGMYDMSPDTRAILDRAPGVDGLYLAAGFSGTGFKKAPAVGLGLAELILNGQATSVDLAPFRIGRFAEGAHLHGTDEYVLPRSWGHGF